MTWNCHEHRNELRISDHATVFHYEHGQLCFCETHWDCTLYYPIQFKDKASASLWIEKGTIAQLQEAWSTLHIGFSHYCFKGINGA